MQAKILRCGTGVYGGYTTLHSEDDVFEYLSELYACCISPFDLNLYPHMHTIRESWRVGNYTIIVDSTQLSSHELEDEFKDDLYLSGILTKSKKIECGQERMARKLTNKEMMKNEAS